MSHSRTCPKCGALHSGDALDGLCPACVLGVVIASAGNQEPSPHSRPESASPEPGVVRFFGNYELLEEIGRGGMGVIYKARQAGLDRLVAVKMILGGHFASRESVQRFQAEAQTAAKLQHPNIVALHEVGEHEGQHFFSMDFVEGRSLAELVREQPLSPARAARYVQRLAGAIHFAHVRGILHRDLKPSNILIDADDQPRITDFGLAKQLQSDSSVTLTGQVLGSPNYMPPEQAAGRSGDIGPWSDVYALGAILYQLLTGRCPFLADTVEQTLQQALHKEPVPPRALNPALPRDLETICLKCLEKDPQRRYRSARELDEELRRFLNHEPIRARPTSPLEKTWRWCRRRPAVASLLAAVAVLLVAITIGSTTAAIRIKRAETLATEKLRDSYLDQARARRVSGRLGQRFESLAAISNAAAMNPSPELRFHLRNEAIACFGLLDAHLEQGRLLPRTARVDEFFRFTPTLDRYACLDERLRISVRRASDDAEVASLEWKGAALFWLHAFSPDGRLLAIEFANRTLRLCDVASGGVRFEIKIGVSSCDFSPDGERIAVGLPNGSVAVYDVKIGAKQHELPDGFPDGHIRFDSTGQRLAWFNRRARAMEIREIESGAVVRTIPQSERVTDVSWSPDGSALAAAITDGRGAVWDVQTGEKRFTLEGHDKAMVRIRFSHSGRLLASSSWDDTIRLWDAFTGRPVLRLPGTSYQLSFREDDGMLAFTHHEDRFHLIELALHPEFSALTPGARTSGPFEPAFSPDGRLLANACKLGVQFWDVGTGRAAGLLSEPACRSVRFAADGSSVFTSGFGGLARWSIRLVESNGLAVVQLGAREALFAKPLMQLASSADGETLAVASRERNQAQVFTLRNPGQPVSLVRHPNAQFVALSVDARWLATGPWGEEEVNVWDARTGERSASFTAGPNATVEFSPDGQWLVTAGEEYRLWKTGSWEPGPAIKLPGKNVPIGYAAFSPDSRALAVVHGGRELHLVDLAGARPLAVFESPSQSVLAVPRFSPDGALLAAAGANGEVFVWHLKLIRRELSALRLDWGEDPPK